MCSKRAQLAKLLIRMTSLKNRWQEVSVSGLRHSLETKMALFRLPKGIRVEPITIGCLQGEWVVPPLQTSDLVLYYLHGGGYCTGSCNSHRSMVAHLACTLNARAFHINYRLAPEYPFPAGVDDCLSGYQWLINQGVLPKYILIGGESAGATLTLTTLLQARDHGMPMPMATFCFSPQTDFTFSSESIITKEQSELFFTRKDLEWLRSLYIQEQDPRHPLISPLYADLRGLPPLMIHVADSEILRDDAILFANKAKIAGVKVTLKVWDDLFHAFQLAMFLPEARQSIQELVDFIHYSGNSYPD